MNPDLTSFHRHTWICQAAEMPGRAFSITGNMGGTGIQLRPGADFPGGPVVKNPPSNAGGTGSIPGQGAEIPHASGQLTQPKINNVNKYFF